MILCPNTGRKPWYCHCPDCDADRLATLPDVPVRPNLVAGFLAVPPVNVKIRFENVVGAPGKAVNCRSVFVPAFKPEPNWDRIVDRDQVRLLALCYEYHHGGLRPSINAHYYQDLTCDRYVVCDPIVTQWKVLFINSEVVEEFVGRHRMGDDAATMFYAELALELPPRAVRDLHRFPGDIYRARVLLEGCGHRYEWLHESVLAPIRDRFAQHTWLCVGERLAHSEEVAVNEALRNEAARQLGIPHLAEEPHRFYLRLRAGAVGLVLTRPELWLQFVPQG
jgi:hypothetical protein